MPLRVLGGGGGPRARPRFRPRIARFRAGTEGSGRWSRGCFLNSVFPQGLRVPSQESWGGAGVGWITWWRRDKVFRPMLSRASSGSALGLGQVNGKIVGKPAVSGPEGLGLAVWAVRVMPNPSS